MPTTAMPGFSCPHLTLRQRVPSHAIDPRVQRPTPAGQRPHLGMRVSRTASDPVIARHTRSVSDYERASEDLAGAIRLGYETERGDPDSRFDIPPEDEIRWLGAWLASEGFSRSEGWASGVRRS